MNITEEDKSNFSANINDMSHSTSVSQAIKLCPTACEIYAVRCRSPRSCADCIGRKHNVHVHGCPVCGSNKSDLESIYEIGHPIFRCVKCLSVISTCGLGDVSAIFLMDGEFSVQDDTI